MNAPRTVLVITGAIGGGHHAAARAVEEAARERWPGTQVVVADVLAGMGRGVGPAFAGIFTAALRWAGWLYGLHFGLLWRLPFYRAGTRAVLGRWSAPGLARLIVRERPDLVVTTFPEAAAGLAHLRRRGRLPVPAAVLVADVAPHPMWCDAALDDHWVATTGGLVLVERAAPGAHATVVGPPVVRAFRPPEPRPPRERPLAVVSCGSLAFGDVAAVCAQVLDAGGDAEVTCARRPELRRRLERLAAEHLHGDRLRVRDWFDDPAETTRRADVVVTTGASATAHEAIACGRALVIVTPIPGHGRAGARVLARAGLARVCGLRDLTRAVQDTPPATPPARGLGGALGALAAAGPGIETRVRGEDALFLHAATERTPQQLGARLLLHDPTHRDWPAQLATLVEERAAGIELLARRLTPAVGGRPLRWRRTVPTAETHVRPEVLRWGSGAEHEDLDAATGAALATRLDPTGVVWALQVIAGPDPGEVVVVAVAHHALGDGLAITDALCALLTDEERPHEEATDAPARRDAGGGGARRVGRTRSVGGEVGPGKRVGRTRSVESEVRPGKRVRWTRFRHSGSVSPAAPARGRRRELSVGAGVAARLNTAARAVVGIAGLAAAGPAGPSAVTGRSGPDPVRHLGVTWDGARVRSAARARGVSTTVLVLAVVAEALARHPAGEHAGVLRAMVPVTERTRVGSVSTAIGNRTAALPVELPVGPMTPTERLIRVDASFTAGAASSRPVGSAAVLAVLGHLPWRLYALVGPRIYGARFLHLLVSVMPGRRRRMHVAGAEVREVHPILPVADGVGLAVGAMNWGRSMGLGLTADPTLVGVPDRLRDGLDDALAALEDAGRAVSPSVAAHRAGVRG